MLLFLLLILGADAFIPISISIGRVKKELQPRGRVPSTTQLPRNIEAKKEIAEGNNGTTLPTTVEVEETTSEEEIVVVEVDQVSQPSTTEEPAEKQEKSRKVETTTADLLEELEATTKENLLPYTNHTTCQDQFSRCYGVSHLCRNKYYTRIMVASCAKTCGYCREFTSLPVAERCRDTYPEDCSHWVVNGFCHAYFYTMPEKVENCMKTCNLC